MSSAKAAKDAVDNAVTEYRRSLVLMERCITSEPVNERALSNKIKDLNEKLSNLNTCHTAWVSKSGLDADQLAAETYSPKWLQSEWEKVDDIQMKVDDILLVDDVPTPPTNAVKIDLCSQ